MTQADMNEWIDRFQIMKSYAETIRLVAWTNQELAEKLSYVIIQYWIYGELPKWYDDPMLLAFFSQVRIPIDKCRAKSWNAKKNWENTSNQNEIKSKSNENQTERKDKKEKIKNKKENKERKWYWEFKKCYLTDEQYQRVLEKYWTKQWEHLIKEVDNYCASKWKKYDNYLAAINTFAKKEWIKEQIPKKENESWIYDLPF